MRRLNGRFLPPKSLRGGGQSHIDGMQARQAHADGADADVQHSAIGAAFHETAFALGQLADLAAAGFFASRVVLLVVEKAMERCADK
ncbi:MAG TPA: hypothetical protein VI457_07475 [Methylococcaceae bacterium]|nr:hypothetical protein [Methylococcaceae bacterium]